MDRAGGGVEGWSEVIWPVAPGFLVWEGLWHSPTQNGVVGAGVWEWSSGEVPGDKDGKVRGRWGRQVGKCGSVSVLFCLW